MSEDGKDLIFSLLQKDPAKRIQIKDVLDHKWIAQMDPEIRTLRRKSAELDDKVMQFVAYSNINLDKVKENSPRSAQKSGFMVGSLSVKAAGKQSDFVAQMKAKKAAEA